MRILRVFILYDLYDLLLFFHVGIKVFIIIITPKRPNYNKRGKILYKIINQRGHIQILKGKL